MAGGGYDTDNSKASGASTLTDHTGGRSVRTIDEYETEIEHLTGNLDMARQKEYAADKARVRAEAEQKRLQKELTTSQDALASHARQLEALEKQSAATEARFKAMEQMMANMSTQGYPGMPTSIQHAWRPPGGPPQVHRLTEPSGMVEQVEDLAEFMHTPNRSNLQGGESQLSRRPQSSPSLEPPTKIIKSTETPDTDDRAMLEVTDEDETDKGDVSMTSGTGEDEKC